MKEEYIKDCAIQALIIEASGLKLSKIFIRHVNNKMVYPNFADYFITEEITEDVRAELKSMQNSITQLKKVISRSAEPKKR